MVILKHTWCNDLAWDDLDAQPPLVQMLNVKVTTSQRSQEINLGMIEQIILFALESRMRFLLNLENHITRLDTR
jgi:hypothetical protein